MTRPLAALASLAASALLVSPAAAQDDGGLYLELGAGITGTDDAGVPAGDASFDTGLHLSALLGYQWDDALGEDLHFGLEIETYYNRQSFDDVLLQTGSSSGDYFAQGGVVLGGVVSYTINDNLDVYGGLGVGYAGALTLATQRDEPSSFGFVDDGAFLAQGKLGMRYALARDLDFFLQYKRLQSEEVEVRDADLDSSFDFEIQQNVFEIGLRWQL